MEPKNGKGRSALQKEKKRKEKDEWGKASFRVQ